MVMYRRYRQMSWLEILEKIEDKEDKWVYVTALRGCDANATAIKQLFTAFIRGKCKNKPNVYVDVQDFEDLILGTPVDLLAKYLIREATELNERGVLFHCLDHIYNALDVINKYVEEYISCRLKDIALILMRPYEHDTEKITRLLKAIKEYMLKEIR